MGNLILEAALDYAARGWPVSPWHPTEKRPLTPHGVKDATTDPEQICAWWRDWPDAAVGIATGARWGLAVVDIDIRADIDGRDSLEALGVVAHPETPTAHSPSGGYHMYFVHPGGVLRSSASKIGLGIDLRADGGSILAPPGPGRFWDRVLGLETPLAELPGWAILQDQTRQNVSKTRPFNADKPLSRYAVKALDIACLSIKTAAAGCQETTLNRECYSIGQAAGAGKIPAGPALKSLIWAAHEMPSMDPRRPWRPSELEKKVRAAFNAGLLHPSASP